MLTTVAYKHDPTCPAGPNSKVLPNMSLCAGNRAHADHSVSGLHVSPPVIVQATYSGQTKAMGV